MNRIDIPHCGEPLLDAPPIRYDAPRSPWLVQRMQFNRLRRREFITLLGGAATAWPLAVSAQQRERMRRLGVLMSQAADDPEAVPRVSAFARGAQEHGWTIGGNVRIDYRWGASESDRFRRYAAELVALAPDVDLWPRPVRSWVPCSSKVGTVPIVFVATIDPIGHRFGPRAWPGRAATPPALLHTSSA